MFFRLRFEIKLKINIISTYLGVHRSTLYRWLKQGQNKPVNISRTKNFRTKIDPKYHSEIIEYIIKNNNITMNIMILSYKIQMFRI